MAHQPRPRKCIYCEERADSREHVIPQWIPKHFGLRREVMNQDQAVGVSRVESIRFDDYASHVYCAAHHREVNRLIENEATRELLKRLFPGTGDTLSADEQRRLAAWAAKTCYAKWGMVRRRVGVPVDHRRHLIRTGEPHSSVFVSISRCTGDRIRVIFARNHLTDGQTKAVTHSYDFVLALGQLVFKVWGPAERTRDVAYKVPTSLATRIWPICHDVARWPPGQLLNDDGVTELWRYDPRSLRGSKS